MNVEWGISRRKALTGAHLSVGAFQLASLLPLPYIFLVVGYPAVITGRNVFSALFGAGIMAIPRLEAVALSLVYRATSNEVVVYFALLALSLVVGLVFKRLLNSEEEAAVRVRQVLAALIAADLVLRLLPLGANGAFGFAASAFGFVFQAACLAFVLLDLHHANKTR